MSFRAFVTNCLQNGKKTSAVRLVPRPVLISYKPSKHPFTMTKSAFLTLVCVVFCLKILAQSCLPDGIMFTTQSEVDNFKADHPGCIQILGTVLIESASITNLDSLDAITEIGGSLSIYNSPLLQQINGLKNVDSVGQVFSIRHNPRLKTLGHFDRLRWVGSQFFITNNDSLTNISSLSHLRYVSEEFQITQNPQLADCGVTGVCRQLLTRPDKVTIHSNAPGCNDTSEIVGKCTRMAHVRILTDPDGDCLSDAANQPAQGLSILLDAPNQYETRSCGAEGRTTFAFTDTDPFTLSIQQFPSENWAVCQNDQSFDPANLGPGDTVKAIFLLKPLRACAQLEVHLGLPTEFPADCSATTQVSIFSKNIGTTATQGLQTTIVFPADGFDLLQAVPPVFAQNGSTLIFQNADLAPFAQSEIQLTVRSKCAGVEPGRTFCWEAFSTAANVCPLPPSNGSEIEISATCDGDSVLFHLKNTGVAATSGPHVFKIIKNKYVRRTENFSLAPGQILAVKVPADGATWRVEATRRDDGTRTAVSLENCGGLKPGLVSAFWQDRGAVGHDFDCRQTVAMTAVLFPPTITAIPAGVGATNLLAPGQPVQYTLRFQNTEPDTARRVVLNGQLAAGLNPVTFRPLAASHLFDWVIRAGNKLELTFSGIALPDSSTDLAGSRGFFTFDIEQMPGLDSGAVISQNLSVQFDNGPVWDSSYTHSVGEPLPYGLSCAPNGITFQSQNDVDRFQADYPGCIHILGQVNLSYTDAQNLNALEEVESVGPLYFSNNASLSDLTGLSLLNECYDIYIFGCPLATLHGLENLTYIPGSVTIQNDNLTSLAGLNRLDSIGQNFLLNTSNLSDLTALSHLKKIGGLFQLCHNAVDLHALDSLETIGSKFYLDAYGDSLIGLEHLRDVGGDLVISFGDYSDANFLPSLQTIGGSLIFNYSYWDRLEGFTQLKTIGQDFQVTSCPNLIEINAFQNLQSVGQSVSISLNPQLQSFNGLQNLQEVGADFILQHNPALPDLASLGALRRVGRNMSVENSGLSGGINGLNTLERVGSEFSFRNNPELVHLNGFQSLKFVGSKLLIAYNQNLVDLPGLEKLDTVGGLYFNENLAVQNLNGLQSLRHVDSLGIYFHHNPFIENLDSLQNLHYIGGDLHIESNYYLRNLNGLRNLDSLGGSMFISTNPNLTTLGGFEKLKKINGGLEIEHHDSLASLDHLNNVRTVGGKVRIFNNPKIVSFSGLTSLEKVGLDFHFQYNGEMSDVAGLSKLDSVGGEFYIGNTLVNSLHGLENLRSVGHDFAIVWNEKLENLTPLGSLAAVGGSLRISSYNGLTGLDGLENLTHVGGSVSILGNDSLTRLNGLNNLANIPNDLFISGNGKLKIIDGLTALQSIGGELFIVNNDSLSNLIGLKNLVSVDKSVYIGDSSRLINLSGLSGLETIGQFLKINYTHYLNTLAGLENLKSVGYLQIARNERLTSIAALGNLQTIALELDISNNPLLSDCSVFAVCDYIQNPPGWLRIENNAPDCNTPAEVAALCHSTPVQVTVLLDLNGNCQPDAADLPLNEAHVHLASNLQMGTRPTDVAGHTHFKYLDNGAFTLTLPQFPTANWEACTDPLTLVPGPIVGDTVYATLLLLPKTQCPELTTRLELPSMFRGCLAESDLGVFIQNTGAAAAENVRTALVVPPVIEVLSSVPPASGQSGDTLFFDTPLLLPFKKQEVRLRLHTRCDTFLFGQTLCWEAFSIAENACSITAPAFSEIRISTQCLADTALRFALMNIGDAPTLAPHQYVVYQNITPLETAMFSLSAHETLAFTLPADGATYRVEATKLDNGTLTARSLENCGGLTSGLVTAFWLEKGAVNYDFDCRQVVGSFDPNQKTAVPKGIGSDHLLEKNQPLQYTIDFQNTGNDTAFRVLLRDVLPENLNVATFRPGLASHSYSWQIRGLDTLEVLFQPIALPDSNVNEPRSHGFFSFEILQKPDLSDGTTLENTAEIVFDYNPPIVTNLVRHTIGRVVVRVDEVRAEETWWQVLGNPTRESAMFLAKKWVSGEKRFDLFDASGRAVRRAEFSGQSFDFQRNGLAVGLYFFKIQNENGHVFSGKIVISD